MSTRKVIIAALVVAAFVVGGLIGWFASHHTTSPAKTTASETHRKILYYRSPMNPSATSDHPMKDNMGMPYVPVYANGGGASNVDVKISPTIVNNLGVRTTEVKQGTLAHRIDTVGYVGYDEDTVESVHTRAAGWIEKLAVKSEGDRVVAGQLLYELFSPKLATAEQEYLTALASGSQNLVAASRERLIALGFNEKQISRLKKDKKIQDRVARHAEQAGVVVKLGVRQGAYVMPSTEVMKLADLGTVWILVEVDASRAGWVAEGQTAIAQLEAWPGKHWKGTVDYIYPEVNPVTRTLKVRLRFPNPHGRLKPGMYAHVTILTVPQKNTVYIPTQALIRTGNSQRVIVALGNGRFDVCPVKAGFESGGDIQILKGLHAGQKVVVSAQFMLDSSANIDAATLRIGNAKPGCGATPRKMPGMKMSGKKPMRQKKMPGDAPERKTMPPAQSSAAHSGEQS
jgi:Cu(I)/Ag(I) efflux system membrane fusion protein